MTPANKIKEAMRELKAKHSCLSLHGGMGYCAYGSKLLSTELAVLGVESSILGGSVLRQTPEAQSARKAAEAIIMDMLLSEDPDDMYSNVKKGFIKRGRRLLNVTGHAVVLVGHDIYDITSEQFGNPATYSFKKFEDCWERVFYAEVVLNEKEDYGIERFTAINKPIPTTQSLRKRPSFSANW